MEIEQIIQTHSDFLAFIVAKAFEFSCPELLRHGRAAAMLVARQATDSAFVEKLFELLQRQPEGQRESAALMDRLRDVPHLRETLLRKATTDATNDDFVVAKVAKRVLEHFGVPYKELPATPLPAFYNLVPSESAQADNFDPPPGLATGERPIWSDDPWTWTSMLRLQFRILTGGCYIPLELLRRRCATFMAKEGGQAAFGPEVEEAILARLRRMHLQFAYRRPLPMAALRAFGKLLRELDVAEAVDPAMFQTIWLDIGGPPLSDWQMEAEPRPSWITIPAMPRRQYGGVDQEEWLKRADNSLVSTLLPGHFVLAEQTFFRVKALRSSTDTERVSLPSMANLDEGIDGLPRLLSVDQLIPMYRESESQLVCQVSSDLYGDLMKEAITICPYVARSIGWVRSAASPFLFTDSSGEVVAKTIRWIDGTNPEGRYEAELFGSGQTLVLSQKGKAQLEGQRGHVSVGVRVERNVVDDAGKKVSRKVLAEA
jgi:hypothetical protein